VTELLNINAAAARDIDEIMPIMASAFDAHYGEAWTAAQCAGILSLPASWLLVGRFGPTPVGFALTRYVLDEAELLLIAVSPTHQGKGVGRRLLEQVITDCRVNHVSKVHLEVRANNEARRFYTSHGFSQTGIRKNYYRGVAGQLTDSVTLTCLI
jgi:[ribosomal protein S18]-alanine N-acetyltransferase